MTIAVDLGRKATKQTNKNTKHFWFPIDNSRRDASISFKLYRRVKHHKKQVMFEKGGNLQNFD